MPMYKLLLIALGGGAGSVLRYLLAGWLQGSRAVNGAVVPIFPVGTISVNVIGSLLIGVMAAIFFTGPAVVRDEYRLAILVGLLGGFTTFSTFSYETLELVNHGHWSRAGLNVLLTNALCLGAVWIGYRIAERLMIA